MLGNKREYQVMAECEVRHWWYQNLHKMTFDSIVKRFDKQQLSGLKVLDLGCGTGGMMLFLKEQGITNIEGSDLSADAVEIAQTRGLEASIQDIRQAVRAIPEKSVDVLICHDVFYFLTVEEQQQAFELMHKAVKPGGLIVMNLPAFDVFRGTHDQAVGINKRFSPKSLRAFIPEDLYQQRKVDIYFWPFLLAPIIASVRLLSRLLPAAKDEVKSDLEVPGAAVNKLLNLAMSLEKRLGLRKLFGSSIFLEVSV